METPYTHMPGYERNGQWYHRSNVTVDCPRGHSDWEISDAEGHKPPFFNVEKLLEYYTTTHVPSLENHEREVPSKVGCKRQFRNDKTIYSFLYYLARFATDESPVLLLTQIEHSCSI
jgi:hypothetical protein